MARQQDSDKKAAISGTHTATETTAVSQQNRRRFIKTAGATGAIASLPLVTACSSSPDNQGGGSGTGGGNGGNGGGGDTSNVFRHGIATGDPLVDRVVFWTRVSVDGATGDIPVVLTVATDPELTSVVGTFVESATAAHDYCVKLDPLLRASTDTSAAQTYYYQFSALGNTSAVGRTRLLPGNNAAISRLRFAVFSCSSIAHGFFNTYAAALRHQDLDAIFHLGDYVYEYGNGEYGSAREYEPAHEMSTLSDYRMRHAQYKREPELMLLHQQNPFITTWDDHETTNDSYRDGAENHSADEGSDGTWETRKAEAIQAYHEWMPIRASGNDLYRSVDQVIFRSFSYGNLVDLICLDTRLEGRDEQETNFNLQIPGFPFPLFTDSDVRSGREMISSTQATWLEDQYTNSTARWRLLGQQVMVGQLRIVGTPAEQFYLNQDQWDGYPEAREALWDVIENTNTVILTGDIHTSWAMDITRDPDALGGYDSIAVEFVTPSVTSPGLPEVEAAGNNGLPLMNPHMKFVDLGKHGYTILDITPDRIENQWWFTGDDASLASRDAGSGETFATSFQVQHDANALGPRNNDSTVTAGPRNDYPAFAPVEV